MKILECNNKSYFLGDVINSEMFIILEEELIFMLDYFLRYFNEEFKVMCSNDLYNDFIMKLGGKRFGKGLFNSFSAENVKKWSEIVAEAYPEFRYNLNSPSNYNEDGVGNSKPNALKISLWVLVNSVSICFPLLNCISRSFFNSLYSSFRE